MGSMKATILFLLAAALSLAFGCGEEQMCTLVAVDGCFVEVGCAAQEACTLEAAEVNALCECLADLGCDQPWFHAYCDGAPYPDDGGCPLCDE